MENGVTMKKETNEIIADCIASTWNCLPKLYPIPATAKIVIISKLAVAGIFNIEAQLSPKKELIISFQFGIGKLVKTKNSEPTINKGVESKKPSRIAIKYLFSPIAFAIGVKTFSNQFRNFCILTPPV